MPLRKLLKNLHDKGILDGLGMQSHLGLESPSLSEYQNALNQYTSLGITIHVTELDVSTADNSPLGQMRLAYRYRSLLSLLRHDYFRRMLCGWIGEKADAGEFPREPAALKNLVTELCYSNAEKLIH